jgi:hypothetical protein
VLVALSVAVGLGAGCSSDAEPPDAAPLSAPHLPAGEAGRVLQRAIDAAGGWKRWASLRDVSYVSTLSIVDAARQVTSDSIGWFTAPLHRGALARMDSIGLPTEVRFGIDREDTWIVSEGQPVLAPGQLALTRFDLVSSLFWFSLPFALAELPATVTYLGEARGADDARWQLLKAEFDPPHPAAPGKWFVLYLDAETGLIDHIHGQLSAPFLRHELWVGQWRHYRDWDGIKKERQRQFFPAAEDGSIVGEMVAEQYVEHVRFDSGFDAHYFDKPAAAGGRPVFDRQRRETGDRALPDDANPRRSLRLFNARLLPPLRGKVGMGALTTVDRSSAHPHPDLPPQGGKEIRRPTNDETTTVGSVPMAMRRLACLPESP